MPSAFESMFSTARDLLMRQHGVAVTYDNGSGPVPVTSAIVGAVAEDFLELVGAGRSERYRHRPVTVSLAEVPNPRRPDKFVIDGEAWTVHERLPQDGGMARVTVVRPVRVEVGGRSGAGRG